jgi:hypothetical protein
MNRLRRQSVGAVALALIAFATACSGGSSGAGSASTTVAPSTSSSPPTTSRPAAEKGRVTLSGTARLDGAAFDAQFLGAVVLDAGLATPCNVSIPPIFGGTFALDVFGSNELAGCGRTGAKVVLWTYSGPTKLWSTPAIDWPTGEAATVAIDFSKADPHGAAPVVMELSGPAHAADGRLVRAGDRVEAYIGSTLCGVATVRTGVYDGYIMHVVGPDSIPGCRTGAPVTFRVDGAPVVETIVNGSRPPRQFALTVRASGPG